MIVATAGHIDHGKTSLVRALTGIDTDHLPEERRRGLTIDLGFAYPRDSQSRIGFVDVPGHERFVRNMISGVTAIDCALLVIAADDGPMPQTLEHLAILQLLGVSCGAVVLTKIDRVGPEQIQDVCKDISSLVKGTGFAGAPVFPLSSITGEGLEPLRNWLEAQAADFGGNALASPARGGHFRMAIDRSFVIDGSGIVVTGAVSSGEVKVDDRLVLSPDGIEIRVRGIYAQNRRAEMGRAGQRCAINIVAPRISAKDIHRGHWLLSLAIHAPVTRFDGRIQLLSSEAKSLRNWSPVHLHLGTADISARVALLEDGPLEPGGSTLAQIVMQTPASAIYGDRFILRDQSGQRTLGGGYVIDPFAPARGRARPQRRALLHVLDTEAPEQAARLAVSAADHGFALGAFAKARNLGPNSLTRLSGALGPVRIAGEGENTFAFMPAKWLELLECAARQIKHLAGTGGGVSKAALAAAFRPRLGPVVLDELLHELQAKKEISYTGGQFRPANANAQLEAADAPLWARIVPLLDNLRPPSVAELAQALKLEARIVERLLQKAARLGLAVQVAINRYYLPVHLRTLAAFALEVADETPGGLVSIRDFRDKSGIGRNLCVDTLEFFDRVGFTGKAGEHRRICKAIADVKWVRVAS